MPLEPADAQEAMHEVFRCMCNDASELPHHERNYAYQRIWIELSLVSFWEEINGRDHEWLEPLMGTCVRLSVSAKNDQLAERRRNDDHKRTSSMKARRKLYDLAKL